MRYLFINSLAGCGSTGRLAAESCRELQAQGHQCLIAYGREAKHCDGIELYRIGSDLDWRLHALQSRLLDNQGFCSRAATRALVHKIRAYDPDVIWLHNLHGYYLDLNQLFSYLKTCGKEIIWTLHDCWSFTGHCAYFDYVGCDRWKTGCHDCPEKKTYPASIWKDASRENYAKKKKLFTGIPNLRLIVPSHWLEERVKQSFLGEYPVEVRYHSVDPAVFHPRQSSFRQEHGLEDRKILLGVANVWDRRKGLSDFEKLAENLPECYKIVLVGLNDDQIAKCAPNILGLPRTADAQQLADIYSAADCCINPGVEETFGMTVLEAVRCGTPVIVYENTACAEIARAFGGMAVPRGWEHLRDAVLHMEEIP